MARTLDRAAHSLRRDAFVEGAMRLIQANGYEQMSIGDLLDDLGASRGAFYHYFDSKVALLEAVVERIVDAALGSLEPALSDPELSATQKVEAVFGGIARWKEARRDLMLGLITTWLSDENAIVREKLRQLMVVRLTPLLVDIVRQGEAEGAFSAGPPEHVAVVLVSLMQGANETASRLFVANHAGEVAFEQVWRTLMAYTEAFERILGLPAGSLLLVDAPSLRAWFIS
jgi:AcrR family transcriptional regulator